eukprot:2079289-Pleurochrysis_carterae.AAC.1
MERCERRLLRPLAADRALPGRLRAPLLRSRLGVALVLALCARSPGILEALEVEGRAGRWRRCAGRWRRCAGRWRRCARLVTSARHTRET